MGRVHGFNVDNRFLERLGFAIASFEYFMALEESEISLGFNSFWPSMVAGCLHIQRADYEDLKGTGEDFLNRYLNGLVGYHPKEIPGRPAFGDAPVTTDVCVEIARVLSEGECLMPSAGMSAELPAASEEAV